MGLGKSETFEKRPGGSPFNVAVGLARLGQKTGFLVKIGTDEFGQELKEILLQEGLDPHYLIEGAGQNTTLAMVALDLSGKPEFRFYRDNAADISLTWDELPAIDPEQVALYHFGSVSLVEPPASETYIRLFKTMKQGGVLTVLDPNVRPLCLKDKEDFMSRLWECISEVDVLKLSDDDLSWITGKSDIRQGVKALPMNLQGLVIVTLGADGAYGFWQGEEIHVDGFKVNVLETTGCGDAFLAGLIFNLVPFAKSLVLLDALALKEAMCFANACAAIVATRYGAANSMPRLAEVLGFLRKHS